MYSYCTWLIHQNHGFLLYFSGVKCYTINTSVMMMTTFAGKIILYPEITFTFIFFCHKLLLSSIVDLFQKLLLLSKVGLF